MAEEANELVRFAKGLIGPEAIAVSGTLRPEAANRLINIIVEDDFLKLVTTERMAKLKKDVQVFGIASRQLVRVAQGSEPTTGQMVNLDEYGATLDAKGLQLFATLKKDFLLDNQGNPNFVAEVEKAFGQQLGLELIDLGFNGTLDDYSDGFLTLNKGWCQIAEDSDDVTKLEIDATGDGWRDTFAAVLDAMPTQFRDTAAFIVSTADADRYAQEVAGTEGIRVDDERAMRYLKYPIIRARFCPEGRVLFTNPKNLVFGICKDIERTRAYHARKRAVEYTFDLACDYEIAVKVGVVYGRPAV